MIKIGAVKGHTIVYNPDRKLFVLEDAEGNNLASAPTQAELEEKANKLWKQKYKFPVPAVYLMGSLYYKKGRITSLNPEAREVYFSFEDKDSYGTREKIRLSRADLYELTDANVQLCDQIDHYRGQIKELEAKINSLMKQFEKPITPEYFGI